MFSQSTKYLLFISFILILTVPGVNSQPSIEQSTIPENISPKLRSQILQLYSPLTETRRHAAIVIGEMKEEAIPAIPYLVSLLDDELSDEWGWQSLDIYESVGKAAAEALGTIGKPALPALMEAAQSPKHLVRYMALHGLSMIKDSAIDQVFSKCMDDPNYIVRLKAVMCIGKTENPVHYTSLIRKINDPSIWVRRAAVQSMGKLDTIPTPGILIAMLNNQDYVIRGWAAESLGELREKSAIPHLIQLLSDQEYFVQFRAFNALIEIGKPATNQLNLVVATSPDVNIRRYAAGALNVLGDYSSLNPLIDAITDSDIYVRGNAIRALARYKSRRAIVAVKKALTDSDSAVRKDAAESLIKMGWAPKGEHERAIYYVAAQQWKEASSLGKIAVPPLEKVLKDADPRIRESASLALKEAREQKGRTYSALRE